MSNEAVLATWPKTGHRLVRALDSVTHAELFSFNKSFRWYEEEIKEFDVLAVSGDVVYLCIVAPGETRAMVRIGIEFPYPDFWASFHDTGTEIGILSGLFRSVWPYLPKDIPCDRTLRSDHVGPCLLTQAPWWKDSVPIDPGPLVPVHDQTVYHLLGVRSPWFSSTEELRDLFSFGAF